MPNLETQKTKLITYKNRLICNPDVNVTTMLFYILITTIFATVYSEKHCVNCKYFVKNQFCNDVFGKCSAFRKNIDTNKIDYLISGKEKIEYKFCSTAREDNNLCGPEGKMYIERSNFIKDFILPLLTTIHDKNNINI